MVLDLGVEPLMKFKDDMRSFEISHAIDDLAEFINGFGSFVVSRGFEIGSGHLDLVLRTELQYEFCHEVRPRRVGQAAHSGVQVHLSINESCSTVAFHKGKSPHNLRMVVGEL